MRIKKSLDLLEELHRDVLEFLRLVRVVCLVLLGQFLTVFLAMQLLGFARTVA